MVRRRISEAQRWQIIGMHTTEMSFKAIGRQMGYNYTVVSRLVRKHTQTNNVKDLPRSGRPLSKPSSGRRLHEAETGSRLTNGSCAMSLNSNHVVLNTMPNVIVDVGLSFKANWTSDGLPLYCSQPTGEKTHTNQQCERLDKIQQTTGNI
jgi:hypothetical protein